MRLRDRQGTRSVLFILRTSREKHGAPDDILHKTALLRADIACSGMGLRRHRTIRTFQIPLPPSTHLVCVSYTTIYQLMQRKAGRHYIFVTAHAIPHTSSYSPGSQDPQQKDRTEILTFDFAAFAADSRAFVLLHYSLAVIFISPCTCRLRSCVGGIGPGFRSSFFCGATCGCFGYPRR
ncbi:hypothetical protein CGGC5_v006631 [Colletotrichum fructicola Nara gc5]|uniref:Uncharacterized protein n=1 Tax=Colletotrichum fructicola (strain Nara gc5) TaxID=1213859 RepID=A0A7J6J7Z1_COLFN|nr:hypothetical protein CGGC5_v006631 [Colletotrichum fructicola Nara gc5]